MLYADGDGDADAARRELSNNNKQPGKKGLDGGPKEGAGFVFSFPCCFVDAEIRLSPPSLQEGEQRMSIFVSNRTRPLSVQHSLGKWARVSGVCVVCWQ